MSASMNAMAWSCPIAGELRGLRVLVAYRLRPADAPRYGGDAGRSLEGLIAACSPAAAP
jgi:hypothetical protein